MTSGLILNPDIYWISYHGSYDFAYILKLLINENIHNNEEEFINMLSLYFNNYYDVKILVKDLDYYFNGGLNKLIYKSGVTGKGPIFQAWIDSIATIEVFLPLIKYFIVNTEKNNKFKIILYDLGLGRDNENTFYYANYSNNSLNANNINNKIYYTKLKQQINNNNNNCTSNKNIKWFCPVVFVNPYGMMNRNTLINNLYSQIKGQIEVLS